MLVWLLLTLTIVFLLAINPAAVLEKMREAILAVSDVLSLISVGNSSLVQKRLSECSTRIVHHNHWVNNNLFILKTWWAPSRIVISICDVDFCTQEDASCRNMAMVALRMIARRKALQVLHRLPTQRVQASSILSVFLICFRRTDQKTHRLCWVVYVVFSWLLTSLKILLAFRLLSWWYINITHIISISVNPTYLAASILFWIFKIN